MRVETTPLIGRKRLTQRDPNVLHRLSTRCADGLRTKMWVSVPKPHGRVRDVMRSKFHHANDAGRPL